MQKSFVGVRFFLFRWVVTFHQAHLCVVDKVYHSLAFGGVAVQFLHHFFGVRHCHSFLEKVTVDVLNDIDALLRETSAVKTDGVDSGVRNGVAGSPYVRWYVLVHQRAAGGDYM